MVQNTIFPINIRPLSEEAIDKFCRDIKNSRTAMSDVSVFISVRKHYEIKCKGIADADFPSIRMISDEEQIKISECFSIIHKRIISFLKRKLAEKDRLFTDERNKTGSEKQKFLSLYIMRELKLSIRDLKEEHMADNPQFYLHFLIRELHLFSAIPLEKRTNEEQDYIDSINTECDTFLNYLYGGKNPLKKDGRAVMNDPTLVFSYANAQLNHYDIIRSRRELTAIEELHINDIKTLFWHNIYRFAIKEYQKYSMGFMTFTDSQDEVKQAAAEKLYTNFRSYRYNLATPTTFLTRQFKEVTFDYLRRFSQNMTHYDSRNYDTVKKAIELFKRHNVKYDIVLLSNYTGLSIQVVKDTLAIASNSLQVNIDDMANSLDSERTNPEDIETNEELKRFFERILQDTLNEKELYVFLEKYDEPEKSYTSIAASKKGMRILGKDALPQAVKLLYDTACLKLYRNPEIRKLAIDAGYLGTSAEDALNGNSNDGIVYIKNNQSDDWNFN